MVIGMWARRMWRCREATRATPTTSLAPSNHQAGAATVGLRCLRCSA